MQSQEHLRFSIVVPCFNQGRFLVDCLESAAVQTLVPVEVIVVDDGSTDQQTVESLAAVTRYRYPFELRVLSKANGGLSSARNFGVERACGNVIVPLDCDDKLVPTALWEYAEFLQQNPDIDIVYPDILHFGSVIDCWFPGSFNRWRLTQENMMVCSSAIRRRVFDAGHRYSESMRQGYEDWEFYMRVCALGPFAAAGLEKAVFKYRRWGFSMLEATRDRHDMILDQIRSAHEEAGVWSDKIGRDLRSALAPAHRLVVNADSVWHATCDDFGIVPTRELERFLREDTITRYLWFGDIDVRSIPGFQIIVQELSSQLDLPSIYAFASDDSAEPHLLVVDRLSGMRFERSSRDILEVLENAVLVKTDGGAFPSLRSHEYPVDVRSDGERLLAVVKGLEYRDLVPESPQDPRRQAEIGYYFHRGASVSVVRAEAVEQEGEGTPEDGRVLLIALPWLAFGGAEFAVRILLEEGSIRQRFERIFIATFEKETHAAHAAFEPLVDGVYHLGLPGICRQRRLELGLELARSIPISDFLVVNSAHGYELMPMLRRELPSVWLAAQVHGFVWNEEMGRRWGGYINLLCSRHSLEVDRVASICSADTKSMVEELYLPAEKVKTVYLGIDQERFRPREDARTQAEPRVLWCGRLDPEKDAMLGLHVAAAFQTRRPEAEFVFLGDGTQREEFAAALDGLQRAGHRIRWEAFRHDVAEVMQRSSCLLMTSVYEGVPIVALEAASVGVPVVAPFRNTGIGEIARHGRFLEVEDREDVEEYCQRIDDALGLGRHDTVSPFFSRSRYATDLIAWLFPDHRRTRDMARAVYGSAYAAGESGGERHGNR